MTTDDRILEALMSGVESLKSGFESLNYGLETLTNEVRLTNGRLDETNRRLDGTNRRLDETNGRLDETNTHLVRIDASINGIATLLIKQEKSNESLTDRVLRLERRVVDLENRRKAQ